MSSQAALAAAPASDTLDAGRRVLELEAGALALLAKGLDASFVAAVDCFHGLKGRVIVTGMGKSGHVGRKIAATLASTGTPAFFVHPGEASHGDMGMITTDDAVLAISNSGEAAELGDIVAYSRRFGLKLVAITGKDGSTLGQAADIVLRLPAAPEACSLGLAPTTSTTATMALGDALAVALMVRRDFQPTDYKLFHPGGQLGRRLKKVGDLMHKDKLPEVAPATPMAEAVIAMTAGGFGCVGVVEDGQLIGIITDGDLRRHMGDNLLALPARAVMTASPRTIGPTALADEALAIMNEAKRPITALFVTEGGRPVGILHIHDCLRAGLA